MKKIIFLFAFIAFTQVTLANANAKLVLEKVENSAELVVEHDYLDLKTCTVTIKGNIGGKPVDVTVTFEADNCAIGAAKFLKELAKK